MVTYIVAAVSGALPGGKASVAVYPKVLVCWSSGGRCYDNAVLGCILARLMWCIIVRYICSYVEAWQ